MKLKSLLLGSLFSLLLSSPVFAQLTPLDINWEVTEEQLLTEEILKKPEKTVREEYHKDMGLITFVEISGKTKFLNATYNVVYTFFLNNLLFVTFDRDIDVFSPGANRVLNYFGNKKLFYLDSVNQVGYPESFVYFSEKNKYNLLLSTDYSNSFGYYYDYIKIIVESRSR